MSELDSFLTAEGVLRWLFTLVLALVSYGILGVTLLASAGWWMP